MVQTAKWTKAIIWTNMYTTHKKNSTGNLRIWTTNSTEWVYLKITMATTATTSADSLPQTCLRHHRNLYFKTRQTFYANNILNKSLITFMIMNIITWTQLKETTLKIYIKMNTYEKIPQINWKMKICLNINLIKIVNKNKQVLK